MIYNVMDAYDMRESLSKLNRDYFSIEALEAFENFCDECDVKFEWDPIALCVEWNEDSIEHIAEDYDIIAADDESLEEAVENYLNDWTIYFKTEVGFMYQRF